MLYRRRRPSRGRRASSGFRRTSAASAAWCSNWVTRSPNRRALELACAARLGTRRSQLARATLSRLCSGPTKGSSLQAWAGRSRRGRRAPSPGRRRRGRSGRGPRPGPGNGRRGAKVDGRDLGEVAPSFTRRRGAAQAGHLSPTAQNHEAVGERVRPSPATVPRAGRALPRGLDKRGLSARTPARWRRGAARRAWYRGSFQAILHASSWS